MGSDDRDSSADEKVVIKVKKLGARGEIYLGKQYTGRQAEVMEIEGGGWTIRLMKPKPAKKPKKAQ